MYVGVVCGIFLPPLCWIAKYQLRALYSMKKRAQKLIYHTALIEAKLHRYEHKANLYSGIYRTHFRGCAGK